MPQASDGGITLLKNARQEAWIVLVVNFVALFWTVGVSYLFGYQHSPNDWVVQVGLAEVPNTNQVQTVAGMPQWLFVGVFFPWLMSTAFTIGVCLGFKDDDLGQEVEES